jgi:predicted ATP-dependent endonuclease of OLD family
MRVVNLEIKGFRGIKEGIFNFDNENVLIGESNAGKSTIIEALSLVLGRDRMHLRQLTEHDFYGSDPKPQDRIKIIATIAGFPKNNPNFNTGWFRDKRAIEKWWFKECVHADSESCPSGSELCAQIAFCARFDHEDLEVYSVRYFYDASENDDPFDQESIVKVPKTLLQQIGFFFVPANRTWDRTISFNSELFRRVIKALGHLPSKVLLDERNRLRFPNSPVEIESGFREITNRINTNLKELLPESPKLQLRITQTDSDSLLKSLVPHFINNNSLSLPTYRHGTGLVSMQTLLLLLELGQARKQSEESFILALEEPEIHLPVGTQRRIVHKLLHTTSQLIITTHSSIVTSIVAPHNVLVLSNSDGLVKAPRLTTPINAEVPNAIRKLMRDYRQDLVDALMHTNCLIPEGRIDFEWLSLLIRITEISSKKASEDVIPFSSLVGIVKTHDSAVIETYKKIQAVKKQTVPIVDGDKAGNEYIKLLLECEHPPERILQWPEDWAIEDVIGWIIEGDIKAMEKINLLDHFDNDLTTVGDLVQRLKSSNRLLKGLKKNYLAYDDIASEIAYFPGCLNRTTELLSSLLKAIVTTTNELKDKHIIITQIGKTQNTILCRWDA